MKNIPTILIGSPLVGDEAVFLRRLYADVADSRTVILANFVVGDRQIDFLVVTPTSAALLELKTYRRPIFGSLNGAWTVRDVAGNVVPDITFNPYQQTLQEAFQLSDAMKRYAQRQRGALPSPKRGHYEFFRSYVCIYPELHPDSEAPHGDRKVRVRSYADVLAALRSETIQPGWTQDKWTSFAEDELRLTRVSLEAAIDCRVLQAQGHLLAYQQRANALLRDGLAPLAPAGDGMHSGDALIAQLRGANNYLVCGPTGSAKTFHLHHLALALIAGGIEHPLTVEAKRYRGGDFWPYLRQAIAPFYHGDLKSLFVALNDAGVKPVLLIDALNECAATHRDELLRGAATFAMHYDARLVVSTQVAPTATAGIVFESIELNLPDPAQKRAIYAFHAGIPPDVELDALCSGFDNAYDLVLAGRCHAAGLPPLVRADLYDRYLTLSLPEGDVFVAAALLRHVAGQMRNEYAIALTRRTFEDLAEQFLVANDAKLSLLDRLATTRLVDVSFDTFSFEHELLLTYLQADDLRRQYPDADSLAERLAMPGSTDLFEFVLPRMTEEDARLRLLSVLRDVDVLRAVLRGTYGSAAQRTLSRALDAFLDKAIENIRTITAQIDTTTQGEKRRIIRVGLSGVASLSYFEQNLASLLGDAILDPTLQTKAFVLLDATEHSLRTAVTSAAREAGVGARYAWSEAMRMYAGVLQHSGTMLPASTMLIELGNRFNVLYRGPVPTDYRGRLLDRATASPRSDFALHLLLEDHEFMSNVDRVSEKLDLIDAAWQSRLDPLVTSALFAVPYMRRGLDADVELKERAVSMLDSYLGENPFVNGLVFEAKSILEAMPPPVSLHEARSEAKAIASADAAEAGGLAELAALTEKSAEEIIAERAHAFVGSIFEDVFQGVYYEVYRDLEPADRLAVLLWASKHRPGFHSSWIFGELLQINDAAALAACEYTLRAVDFDSSFQQDDTGAAIAAIQGCARWRSSPPVFGTAPALYGAAFIVIGETLFWAYRDELTPERCAKLRVQWSQLDSDALLAAGAILVALDHARWTFTPDERSSQPKLEQIVPDAIEDVALECIRRRADFAVVHKRHNFRDEGLAFFVETLGTCGSLRASSRSRGSRVIPF
jgi:hypothetical protein